MRSKTILQAALLAWLAAVGPAAQPALAAAVAPPLPASGDIGGTVIDSTASAPLPGGEVRISQGGKLVASTITDHFGRYAVHNLPAGSYSVEVRYLGYRAQTRDVTIGDTETLSRADFPLGSLPITLPALRVPASVPAAADTRTGNQTFKQNDYH